MFSRCYTSEGDSRLLFLNYLNILFAIINPARIQIVIIINAVCLLLPNTTIENTAPTKPKINPRPILFAFFLDIVVPEKATL